MAPEAVGVEGLDLPGTVSVAGEDVHATANRWGRRHLDGPFCLGQAQPPHPEPAHPPASLSFVSFSFVGAKK